MSDRLATIDIRHAPKSGVLCLLFWGAGSPSNTMWPGLR